MGVYEFLERSAAQWPYRSAVIDRHGEVDYRTLHEQVAEVREQLRRMGVEAGHAVGVMARNGLGFIAGAFAALGCGATVLPISPALRRAELDALLREARVHAVLHDGTGPDPEGGERSEVAIPGRAPLRLTWTGAERGDPCVGIVPDAAFVRFTSGTTGLAKGVVLSHRGVIERTAAANRGLGLTCEDVIIWVLPMAFHFFVSIALYLRVGAAIVVCPDHFAETLLAEANRHRGTFLYAAPLHYRLLVADRSGKRFETLRRAVSTAIALPPGVARDFRARFGLPITQAYGIIEVGLPMINIERPEQRPESVGKPLPDYDAAILDDGMRPVPAGRVGQLGVRGPGMFAGYLSPPLRREEVLQDGWFLTGDLATQDEEGFVTIVGRCNGMINVAGNKVFPEEVENVLNCHPKVLVSRVCARQHREMGEVVHADLVLKDPSQPAEPEEIIAFCQRSLSAFKVPQSVAFVSDIALTASGKILRHRSTEKERS